MRRTWELALAGACIAIVGCTAPDGPDFASAPLDTEDRKASYGIGLNIGRQLTDARDRLDRAAFLRGIEDAMQGNDPDLTPEEINAALQAFSDDIQAAAEEDRARAAESNAAEGEAFLAENGGKEGVVTTDSGLQYEVLREGDGARPTGDDRVRVHYRGTLIDGTEFDSSYGGDPAVFSVSGLIPGFTEALTLMNVGSQFRIAIPSDLGYGPRGAGGDIGPNATLIFELELLEIVGAG